ncbi:uncharacterized protein LOC112059007 isoform X2 [Chrysemys picta bellii]|uniref:uncharacterized protein LOC112059007 isoform X2 n=1 Tax=Chrysemys picta bellii TaxID=8478 RepID=UPI0032B28548
MKFSGVRDYVPRGGGQTLYFRQLVWPMEVSSRWFNRFDEGVSKQPLPKITLIVTCQYFILFGLQQTLQRAQVTTESSSAQVTMQASNRKRAPAWTVWEVLGLIAIWGEDSVLAELRSKRQNGKTFDNLSKGMMERGHNRDSEQCRMKVKELRQAYQKTKEANGRSGSEPQTCCFHAELHAILGGAATTTPPLTVDSEAGIISSATPEDSADRAEEEEDELAESTQHSILPNSQDLFLSLTELPSQASIQDHDPMEGTSAANFSSRPPPSRRLSQIRRRRKRTRDEMFLEIMECTCNERAHLNEWKDMVSKYRKDVSECEVMRDARDERWQAAMLGLLHDQTDMLRYLVELQEQQQDKSAAAAAV